MQPVHGVHEPLPFLAGGGEMGGLIRAFDWSDTSVGPFDQWPQSLRTTLGIVLHSKFPMFLWWGPELICFYNDAYRPSLGQNGKHPSILGLRAEEAWPEIWDIIKPLIDQVLTTRESVWMEDQLIPIYRNGKIEDVYWTFSYSAVNDEADQVGGVLVVCNETTGKVNALKNLEESNRRYFSDIMHAPVAMCFFRGKNHTVEIANELMLGLWGKTAEEVMNKPIFEGLPESKGQGLEQLLDNVYCTGENFVAHERPIDLPRNGKIETTYINFTCQALKNPDGTISGVVAIALEVTDQVLARKKIEQSEVRFRTLANSIPQLAWMTDAEGWIYWYNQRWYDYTGTTLEEMQGWGWRSVHHPELVEGVTERFKKAIETGEEWEDTFLLRGKDGKYRWFLSRALPIRNDAGKILQWFGSNTDISAQREIEQALKNAKEQLELTFQNTPTAVYLFGKKGEILFANDNGARLMGYKTSKELLEEKNFSVLKAATTQTFDVLTEDRQPFPLDQTPTSITLSKGKTAEAIFLFIKKSDNTEMWCLTKSSPIFDANGELSMVLTASTDITAQKTSEQILRYRKALLEAHNAASLDGILLVDAKGKILSYNQRYIEIWNMPQEIADSKDDETALAFAMTQLVNPQQFIDKVKYLYEHPTATSIDELEFKDGKLVERHGYQVVGEDGTYYAWSWTFRDVTEQKLYERTIKESEERFRTLAETLPQLVWITNDKGEQEYASSRWEEYTGIKPTGAETWGKILHPEDMEGIVKAWTKSMAEGIPYRAEARLRSKAGQYRWHFVHGEPVSNGGEIVKWIGAFTDIHEMKELDRHKDEFMSIVSHELKTPVTSLKAYSQLLERKFMTAGDPESAALMQRMDKQINKLQSLIGDLLETTKLQEGKMAFKKEVFTLNALVSEIAEELQRTTSRHNIIIEPDADCSVMGDRERIGQVLTNFISNAIKYSPYSDKIIVKTKRDNKNEKVVCSVQDFGIGIPQNRQEKIFQRFYRVTGEKQDAFPGLGLGLYISAEIINRQQGEIWFESSTDEGATFYFSLPVYKE
jgi:hypothetical protein